MLKKGGNMQSCKMMMMMIIIIYYTVYQIVSVTVKSLGIPKLISTSLFMCFSSWTSNKYMGLNDQVVLREQFVCKLVVFRYELQSDAGTTTVPDMGHGL